MKNVWKQMLSMALAMVCVRVCVCASVCLHHTFLKERPRRRLELEHMQVVPIHGTIWPISVIYTSKENGKQMEGGEIRTV